MKEETELEREEETEHDIEEATIDNRSPPEAEGHKNRSKFFVCAFTGIDVIHELVETLAGLVSKMSSAELELLMQ